MIKRTPVSMLVGSRKRHEHARNERLTSRETTPTLQQGSRSEDDIEFEKRQPPESGCVLSGHLREPFLTPLTTNGHGCRIDDLDISQYRFAFVG
jgi:hypothetical protein